MATKAKRVVIIGPAFSGNKGAAAMLESSVQTLNSRDTEFTLLSHYPAEDAKLNPYPNLSVVSAKPVELALKIAPACLAYRLLPFLRPGLRKMPAIAALADADVVLEEGGITFADGREIYLLFNVATILPALLLGKPVVKVSQALGPFKNPINRLASKMFLPRIKLIVARGAVTKHNLDSLHLDNVRLAADYSFTLSIGSDDKRAAQKYLSHQVFKQDGKTIGVSPSNVIKKKFDKKNLDYISFTAGLIDWLMDDGYGVALVPHSVREGAKTHNNDLPLCREIFRRINRNNEVCFVDEELSSQTLRYLIGQCDLFIASRFHAMVSALAMGVPVLVLGWSHKYAEVLEMFKLQDLAFDSNAVSLDKLKEQFRDFAGRSSEIRFSLKQNGPKVKASAFDQARWIKEILQ